MKLAFADAIHFYELFITVLDYANKEFHITTKLKDLTDPTKKINMGEMKKIVAVLWENKPIFKHFLDASSNLSDEDRNIVLSWMEKGLFNRLFFWERDLTRGSIFIQFAEGHPTYLVNGIFASMSEMFSSHRPPMPILATILPYKNEIVVAGWPSYANTYLPNNIAAIMREEYMTAKSEGKILSSL